MRSRVNSALINTAVGIFTQLILAILNFILRRVFVNTIGLEYLGVNGLFGNVLSLLALTESGVGIALSYSLYQPIKDDDKQKIAVLLRYFKTLYYLIASVVFALGIVVSIFIGFLVKESSFDIGTLRLYFFMFLIQNICTYFLAYKISFLNANQQNYVVSLIQMVTQCVILLLKIFFLYVFESFFAYLVLNIASSLMTNIFISIYTNRKYPGILNGKEEKITKEDKSVIVKNIKGLFFHKVGSFVVYGTDNILISVFINLRTVGMYSNYSYVLTLLNTLSSQFFNAIIPSMGNYIVDKSRDEVYQMYRNIQLINFFIFAFCTTVLLNTLQPFIQLWLGTDSLLSITCLVLLLLNFYLNGMRTPIQIMKNSGGKFYEDRISPLIESIVNIVASVAFTYFWGLPGVFIGTILSGLAAPFWISPKYVYKGIFKKELSIYFYDMALFFAVLVIACICSVALNRILYVDVLIFRIICRIFISSIVFLVIFFCFFSKSDEYRYFKAILIRIYRRINVRG